MCKLVHYYVVRVRVHTAQCAHRLCHVSVYVCVVRVNVKKLCVVPRWNHSGNIVDVSREF